jgi:uncharacterized protein
VAVPAHLSVVTLGVSDLAASTAFYTSLGWVALPASSEAITFFQLGAVVLGLFAHTALAHDAQVDSDGSGFRGVTLAINLASPGQVDDAVAEWARIGGGVVKSPEPAFWGGYSGYVADPDRHLWEIAYNPHSPQWAAPASGPSA